MEPGISEKITLRTKILPLAVFGRPISPLQSIMPTPEFGGNAGRKQSRNQPVSAAKLRYDMPVKTEPPKLAAKNKPLPPELSA
ncbi:MAG: hypothetical protein WBE71_21260 [Xanthobacteraceae bacterium]